MKYFDELDLKTEIVKRGDGYDFLISLEYEGEIFTQTVEAKGMHVIKPKQIERLREGGLLAEVNAKHGTVTILLWEDIKIGEPDGYRYTILH